MKKSVLISLICSMLAVIVIIIGVLFVMILTGRINVTQQKIVISSASAAAIYNGETLTEDDWYLSQGDIKPGHILSVSVTGQQRSVGISENYVSATVLDANGVDVTSDYIIEYRPGILNVKERELRVVADSAMKLYDGEPLTAEGYTIDSLLSLLPGDVLEVTVEGSITDVGSTKNKIASAVIYDETGVDVSRCYDIQPVDGTLLIYSSEALVIRTKDAIKVYDGTPLVSDEWELEYGTLPEGYTIEVTPTGSQTEIGVSDNTFTVKILDEFGNDVTDNFEIVTVPGTLTVAQGKGNENENSEDEPTGKVMFNVYSDKEDIIYLKMSSKGDFDPATNSWSEAPEYTALINDTSSAYYLPTYALKPAGYEDNAITVDIESLCGSFVMPYYSTEDNNTELLQTSDTTMIGDAVSIYTVKYYSFGGVSTEGTKMPSIYQSYEDVYAQFVKDNYTSVDTMTKEYLQGIISADSKYLDPSKVDIVSRVANYIQSIANYNLDYDRSIDEAENPVKAFFEEGEGVCRHYAKAATLLYRTLNIPARYTEGFMSPIEAYSNNEITDYCAHAWVEVYVDDLGWVKVEVTGSSDIIEIEIEPVDTKLQLETGKSKYSPYQKVTITKKTDGADLSNYILEPVVSGDMTKPGKTKTEITNLVIKTKLGKVVYDEENNIGLNKFSVKKNPGNMQVYREKLTYSSKAAAERVKYKNRTYGDGRISLLASEITKPVMPAGYSYQITNLMSVINAGSHALSFDVIIKDSSGKNVTDEFWINKVYGSFKIAVKEITVTAGSTTIRGGKEGQSYTFDEIDYSKTSTLCYSDYISSWNIDGTQVGLGSHSNVVRNVKIQGSEGDATANYKIKYVDGTITVTKY